MGDVSRRVIESLGIGGDVARDALEDAGELLRMAWQPGFVPFKAALAQEAMTPEEAALLRAALVAYSESEGDGSSRVAALSILAREGRPELRDRLVNELQRLLTSYRVVAREMFQVLLALEDVGDRPFPQHVMSRRLTAVEENASAASSYLQARGLLVPWQ